MKIIAIANQKGGVGKTTTAVNLSAALAYRGFRVLLIDLDSQANATSTFLPDDVIEQTLYDVVAADSRVSMDEARYETVIPNLDMVPASIRLARVDKFSSISEQYRLKKALAELPLTYDFTIIDCPPTLGMALTMALLAATHVLVPVAAQYYPLEGVLDLVQTVEAARDANSALEVLGFLMTCYDTRGRLSPEAANRMRERYGEQVFTTMIRQNIRLQYAPSFQQTIFEHDPKGHGANDYTQLSDEVLSRLKLDKPLRLVKEGA